MLHEQWLRLQGCCELRKVGTIAEGVGRWGGWVWRSGELSWKETDEICICHDTRSTQVVLSCVAWGKSHFLSSLQFFCIQNESVRLRQGLPLLLSTPSSGNIRFFQGNHLPLDSFQVDWAELSFSPILQRIDPWAGQGNEVSMSLDTVVQSWAQKSNQSNQSQVKGGRGWRDLALIILFAPLDPGLIGLFSIWKNYR
jgi:hypothetical protein